MLLVFIVLISKDVGQLSVNVLAVCIFFFLFPNVLLILMLNDLRFY